MRNAFLFLFFFCAVPSFAVSDSVESLLHELDQVLQDRQFYMQQKENRIERLKNQRKQELSVEKQFELSYTIIDEYKSYLCDSGLVYVDQNIHLAENVDNPVWLVRSQLQKSFILSTSGLFIESKENLESIPQEYLSTDELRIEYYARLNQYYSNLIAFTENNYFNHSYEEKRQEVRDSILYYLPEGSSLRHYYLFNNAMAAGDMTGAESHLNSYLATLQPGTHEYAMKSYDLSTLYHRLGDEERRIPHLIQAVTSDVKDAIKENKALLDLSIWLYEQKDIERAYQYIQYALDDVTFYNSRFRYPALSQKIPTITEAYSHYTRQQQDRLLWLLTIISVLSIALFIIMFVLQRQKRKLAVARKGLDETNQHMAEVNEELNTLNQKLLDSDRVKEEYIGHFLDQYSEYIDRLDDYRKMINNKIAAKRFDELLKMTSSSNAQTHDDVKELYMHFDEAFLKIYPGFVSFFNNLLKEEERFILKKGELLNTELRVFALIRMGITDTNKIASFLRCSVQTVYNYRSKIKRKAINEHEDIEERIKQYYL